MEPRIRQTMLRPRDAQRSLTFYRDGLGLPATWGGSKGVVFFPTSGTRLARNVRAQAEVGEAPGP